GFAGPDHPAGRISATSWQDVSGLGAAGGCDAAGSPADAVAGAGRPGRGGAGGRRAVRPMPAVRFGPNLPGPRRAGGSKGSHQPARPGGAVQAAVPLPGVWPVFFPLRIVSGRCHEAPLTPQAARRLAREAATQQGFEPAARARIEDCAMGAPLHAEQVRRWGEALGASVVARRDAEVEDYHRGLRPASPANAVPLLVIGLDGGRYQGREKDQETGSRWREEKVLTVSSYIPGDGISQEQGGRAPKKLVTTQVATAQSVREFGPLARVEAERRGLRQAEEVIALGDGGNWIDPLLTALFHVLARIIDWFHASEHLWDCAKAVYG